MKLRKTSWNRKITTINNHLLKRWSLFVLAFFIVLIICWKIANISESFWNNNNLYFLDDYREKHYNEEHTAPLRIVHLDLKGAPPKMSYIKEILPAIIAAGGNALLIEYEDMFPFEGQIKNISSLRPYTKDQIRELLQLCEYYGIEVIPLVQTFGHLEYVLKLDEFEHLREIKASPQEICPSNENSVDLIEEMIMQVLKLHKNAKRIHIGCDEVYNINVCSKCLKRNSESRQIFVNHVTKIAKFIRFKYPAVIPLIWDDMIRTWPPGFLESTQLNKHIEPMIWCYGSDILTLIPHRYWYWYFKHFKNIWIAGAFKGATQPLSLLPDLVKHYENQKSWLRFIAKYIKPQTRIMGFVLTGWSRYDHFASVCELLPVSMPSLILNLLMISSAFIHQVNIISSYNEILKCRSMNDLNTIFELKNIDKCTFSGLQLIPLTFQLIYHGKQINFIYERLYETNAWLNEYNAKKNYINGWKIKKQFEEYKFQELNNSFTKLSDEMWFELRKYYTDATVEEWFQEHVVLYLNKLKILSKSMEISMKLNKWGRRNG